MDVPRKLARTGSLQREPEYKYNFLRAYVNPLDTTRKWEVGLLCTLTWKLPSLSGPASRSSAKSLEKVVPLPPTL